MSIYDNGFGSTKSQRRAKQGAPSQKVDTSKILNDKELTGLVNKMKKGPKTAKEILYDSDENIVGILQRDNLPYLFSDSEAKEFIKIYKG